MVSLRSFLKRELPFPLSRVAYSHAFFYVNKRELMYSDHWVLSRVAYSHAFFYVNKRELMYSDHWVLSRVAYTHAFFMLILIINIKRKDHKETMGFLIYIEREDGRIKRFTSMFSQGEAVLFVWQREQLGRHPRVVRFWRRSGKGRNHLFHRHERRRRRTNWFLRKHGRID